jgi:hypothetical protein
MIPTSCLLEVVFDHVHYSRDTRLSIVVVLIGVAVCTVTDVSVNVAVIAVWSVRGDVLLYNWMPLLIGEGLHL